MRDERSPVISLTSTNRNTNTKPRIVEIQGAKRKRQRHAQVGEQWVRPPPILDTVKKLEYYAEDLYSHLSNAIVATGLRSKYNNGKAAPWWTPECKAVYRKYQEATDEQ